MTKVHYYDVDGKLTRTEDIPDPPEQVAEQSVTDEATAALASLRTIATGVGPMTTAQLTVAVRGMARVLIVLVRLQLKKFEGTE